MIIRRRRVYTIVILGTCFWFMCSILLLIYDRLTIYSATKLIKGKRNSPYDLERRTWLARYENLPRFHNPKGPGEYGIPVNLNPSFAKKIRAAYKEHELNIVVSDLISLHRRVPDLRSKA